MNTLLQDFKEVPANSLCWHVPPFWISGKLYYFVLQNLQKKTKRSYKSKGFTKSYL